LEIVESIKKYVKDEYFKARLKITFLITGISFLILFIFGGSIYYFFRNDVLLSSLNEVKDIIIDISKNIEQTQGLEFLKMYPFALPEGTYICIYNHDNKVIFRKNTDHCDIKQHFTSLKIDGDNVVYGTKIYTTRDLYRVYVGRDITGDFSRLGHLRSIILYTILGISGFIFLVSFWLSKRIVAPLKEAMEKQERFIQNVSHDLRTPLTVITNHLFLLKHKTPEEAQHYVDKIQKTIKYMKNIISDLTFMAQLKQQKFEKTKVNINELIKDQLDILSPKIEEKNIIVELNEEGEIEVLANHRHMEMLIANLLSNAVKYNKELGEIIITIGKDYLSIKNTGVLIKNPDRIFERFYREDEARTSSKGSGIGLSIVKEIVDLYGFKIKVKVENGYNEFIVKFK
jgi:two-component system OmpR family sensor kinase